MSTLFRKLKQTLFPSRYLHRTILDFKSLILIESKRMEDRSKQMLDIANTLVMLQTPLYRQHLHNLENPSAVIADKIVFGYALERVARKLSLRIMGDDFSKPTLCMVCVGNAYGRTVELGTQTKLEYCKVHGYNMVILEAPPYRFDRHPAWLRIPLIFRLMQLGYTRVFYLDADSLITNPKISLESFFDCLETADRHLMIAEDVFSLNTGSFFIRKTWQSLTLLDLLYEGNTELNTGCWEQRALVDLIEQNPTIKSLLYLEMNARKFNSMPFDPPFSPGLPTDCSAYAWQLGDFICHFAGTRDTAELSLRMKKFYEMIKSV